MRQTRQVLDDEHGTNLSEDQLVGALCNAVLDGCAEGETTGRAKFQVAVTVCERCKRGWQEGAGAQVAISPAAVERALCDAQHIGSLDGEAPARAARDVPPSVARFVRRRDGGRCRVPGCRSARGLEVHHIVHRADGGGHDPSGLCLLCSSCHQAHHAGTLQISGTAEHLEVRRPGAELACAVAEDRVGVGVAPANAPATPVAAELANCGPHVGAPDVQMPDVQMPDVQIAAMEMPDAQMPAVQIAGMEMPDVQMPVVQIAGMEMPDVQMPDVQMPAVQMPVVGTRDAAQAMDGIAHQRVRRRTSLEHAVHDGTSSSAALTPADDARAISKLDLAKLRDEAKRALRQMGWTPAIASAAVAAASDAGAATTIERLAFEASRRCLQLRRTLVIAGSGGHG